MTAADPLCGSSLHLISSEHKANKPGWEICTNHGLFAKCGVDGCKVRRGNPSFGQNRLEKQPKRAFTAHYLVAWRKLTLKRYQP
jgi:hypothetical protein